MDPLSITCSAIAFVGVCRKVSKQLKLVQDLRRAPEAVSQLYNEIGSLQEVLQAVEIAGSRRECDKLTTAWTCAFNNVNDVLQELNKKCEKAIFSIEKAKDPRQQFMARCKWLHERGKVEELRTRLRTARLDLANQMAATSMNDILEVHAGVKALLTSVPLWLAKHSGVKGKDSHVDSVESTHAPYKPPSKSKMLVPSNSAESAIVLHDGPATSVLCMSKCSCACHQVSRMKTPACLSSYLGSLLLQSNGVPGWRFACDETQCRQRMQATVQISYRFPEWLLNRMVSSIILFDHLNGPSYTISTPRVVRNECDLFYFAKTGNIAGIQRLFSERIASPRDVSREYNYTALHFAVDAGQVETARFLIKHGAPKDLNAASEETPADLAWNKIATRTIDSTRSEAFSTIFEKETWLEDRCLTTLHQTVLDLLPTRRNLREELQISTKMINAVDVSKRTPLSWAAELGNVDHVKVLLEFGADTEIKSVAGLTALHYAAQSAKPACLNALLEKGAKISARNDWSQHALNILCFFSDDANSAEILLRYGIDIDEKDQYGSSPLSNAAFTNRPSMIKCLLKHGADIETGGHDSIYPLSDAVYANCHEAVETLLDHGASTSGKDLLHTLAWRGDLRTMELMANRKTSISMHKDTLNDEGRTALDFLNDRDDVSEPMRELFTKISDGTTAVDEDDDDKLTFHDAIEDHLAHTPIFGVVA